MDEERRFVELMAGIAADVHDGTRQRVPAVGDADAILLARGLQREVDRQETARAEFAASNNADIACSLGCTACCESVVVVYRPEALLAALWLTLPENHDARDRFLARYPRWRAALGSDLEKFQELHDSGDRTAAEAFYQGLRRHRAMCAFNHEGACEIYLVRPNVCRYTMALDTNAYCSYDPAAEKGPAFLGFPPMDDLVERCRALLKEADSRMEAAHGPAALCRAVHDLLAAGKRG
jgi:hypothetical protein